MKNLQIFFSSSVSMIIPEMIWIETFFGNIRQFGYNQLTLIAAKCFENYFDSYQQFSPLPFLSFSLGGRTNGMITHTSILLENICCNIIESNEAKRE